MSDLLILPDFPGADIAIKRVPGYSTNVQNSAAGREVAISYESYPRYEWELKFNVLRDYLTVAEARQLEALFHALKGRGDYFLFTDPENNSAVDSLVGVGTGTNPNYRCAITRVEPASGVTTLEPVQNTYNNVVKVNGVTRTPVTHYNISAAGVITFTAGNFPAAGHEVRWSGNFRYRCRLLEDKLPMSRIVAEMWASSFKFRSVKV